jgi:hypothetical protein
VLVACVALTLPALAQVSLDDCPCEARNGSFEVDMTDYTGEDYDGTGLSGSADSAPDHWTYESNISWVDDPGITPDPHGDKSMEGYDGEWIWQIQDETTASWYYDDTGDPDVGWVAGENTCWDGLADAKLLGCSYYGWFTDWETQAIHVRAYGWTGTDPTSGDDFTPVDMDSLDSDWVAIGQASLSILGDNAENQWQNGTARFQTDFQPQWVLWGFTFDDDSGDSDYVYLDDVCFKGKCLGSDAPELSTWLLLAATGAFGGFVRRRRRT